MSFNILKNAIKKPAEARSSQVAPSMWCEMCYQRRTQLSCRRCYRYVCGNCWVGPPLHKKVCQGPPPPLQQMTGAGAAETRKKKKKRSACMKMPRVMKKKVDRPKINDIKRPACTRGAIKKRAWRKNFWKVADGDAQTRWKKQRKMQNVRAHAKKATRNGWSKKQSQMQNFRACATKAARKRRQETKSAQLAEVAAATHAAEVSLKKQVGAGQETLVGTVALAKTPAPEAIADPECPVCLQSFTGPRFTCPLCVRPHVHAGFNCGCLHHGRWFCLPCFQHGEIDTVEEE